MTQRNRFGPTVRLLAATALVCTSAAACGYRLVKRTDVTARRFAADSAQMFSLEQQIATLRSRCHDDSVRMADDASAAAQAAAAQQRPSTPTPPTIPDSVLKARDAEILALRDQLTRANAELDRIKKRLANPRG